ncbi:MAG: metallophosphoesterase [Bacteroidales bacterium]|nr:metallophosphoesterase [Bacteroidales bacterium]
MMLRFLKILSIALIFSLVISLVLVLLVRFANGQFSSNNTILLGYDEVNKRFQVVEPIRYSLDGIDGPYVIGDTNFRVSASNAIIKTGINGLDSSLVLVHNEDRDSFYITHKANFSIQPAEYALPSKVIAISDIEGNFNALSSFLIANEVIDSSLNWIFRDGHLVLNGDFMDRGNDVVQTLWLIYKLEGEAELQHGRVHYVLGNHELLNLQGRFKYAKDKYIRLAQVINPEGSITSSCKGLYSSSSELGRWLRTKNSIIKLGSYIFVHAGLSPDILKSELCLDDINAIARANCDKDLYNKPEGDSIANFLIGRSGPFWYRGLVKHSNYYEKITESDLRRLLDFYQADRFVIGHTIVDSVCSYFSGKVICIDVKHGSDKYSSDTQGLLIDCGVEYRVDACGRKKRL